MSAQKQPVSFAPLDFSARFAENMLEEEDNGVERLMRRRCRDLPLDRHVGQKPFDLAAAHAAGVPEMIL